MEATRRVNKLHPMYSYLPKELISMLESVPKQPGITMERDVIDDLRKKHSAVFGHKATVYLKALQLMHKMVRLIATTITLNIRCFAILNVTQIYQVLNQCPL